MRFGRAKTALLIISLSLSGCLAIAPPPAVDLCQFNGNPRAFFCENTDTHKQEKRPIADPRMKASQCLSADDYRAMSDYVDYLTNEAEQRCR